MSLFCIFYSTFIYNLVRPYTKGNVPPSIKISELTLRREQQVHIDNAIAFLKYLVMVEMVEMVETSYLSSNPS